MKASKPIATILICFSKQDLKMIGDLVNASAVMMVGTSGNFIYVFSKKDLSLD